MVFRYNTEEALQPFLEAQIRKYAPKAQRDWDELSASVFLANNTALNRMTQEMPFHLANGLEPTSESHPHEMATKLGQAIPTVFMI